MHMKTVESNVIVFVAETKGVRSPWLTLRQHHMRPAFDPRWTGQPLCVTCRAWTSMARWADSSQTAQQLVVTCRALKARAAAEGGGAQLQRVSSHPDGYCSGCSSPAIRQTPTSRAGPC